MQTINDFSTITWEEAVRWYRDQPENAAMVRACYFDLPVLGAARRFADSAEFAETLRLLGGAGAGRTVLDLGAGNGIASYALAQNGWRVTALEPDPSGEVGAGAIRAVAEESGLPIAVVPEWGEKIPLPDNAFDAVYARQVLHHARDLDAMLREIARLLRPGGIALAVREHVAEDAEALAAFRRNHPLHHLYGGENAYPLRRYQQAFARAGLRLRRVWGPQESVLNDMPGAEDAARAYREFRRSEAVKALRNRRWHWRLLARLAPFREAFIRRDLRRDLQPGDLFSFLSTK